MPLAKGRATLLLLVGLAALVGALVWWDARRPSTEEKRAAAERLLPGFVADGVRAIDVEAKGGLQHLRRAASGEGGWRLDGNLRADSEAVDALVGELGYAHLERRVPHPDAEERKVLGLERPRVTLTVDGKRLALGNDDPSGHWVYVARDGEPDVLVVEHRLLEVADRAPAEWRSLRLIATAPDGIHTLAFGALRIERSPRGWLVGEERMRADGKNVDALLGALDRARASRVLDGKPPESGRVLAINGNAEGRFQGACPGHAGETEVDVTDGGRLCFADEALKPLFADPIALRDRHPFSFALDDVDSMIVRRGVEDPLRLVRENGIWRVVSPLSGAGPVADARVRAWLKTILDGDARGFGPAGKPLAAIDLREKGGAVESVTFGRRDGVLTAQRGGEQLALELPPDVGPMLARSLDTVGAATFRAK